MPTFNFALKIAGRAKRKTSTSSISIIHKDIEAVIKADAEGKYYIVHEDVKYSIHPDCYNNKGNKEIYLKRLDKYGHRIKIIRDKDSRVNMNNEFYCPFAPGLVVKGNIIKDHGLVYYYIKQIYNLGGIDLTKDAVNEWREYLDNEKNFEDGI